MSELFLKIVNVSISAGWLVLVVLVLRLILKKAPKWVNVLLWGIVAIKLVCPFSIESALSLIPSAQTINPEVALNPPMIDSGIQAIDNIVNPVIGEATLSFQPEKELNLFRFIMPYLAGVWSIGIVLLLAYTVISYLRLCRKVTTAVRYQGSIFQSEHISTPFVLGIIRPRIYLPFKMDVRDLEHVVAHEQAHIRRKDHWWKPLGFLLLTIHWFNPLMWLAYVLLCRDIELACDEKVIKGLGNEHRADYTQALVACGVNRRMIAACPLAFGEVGVKERVKSVMNYKKPAFWVIALAIVVCAAVAVCFLTDPVTSVRNPWVQEYVPGAEGILGSVDKEKYERISEDFAIGADQYGRAVFKDPEAAFDTFVRLYADGIAAIQAANDLRPISHTNFDLYKKFGWQLTDGTPEVLEQASFVSGFLDIYENSYAKDIPTPGAEPTTTEPAAAAGTYIYEGKGFGGSFTITLFDDGTFHYYEGLLSSYIGLGTWTQDGDTITLTEDTQVFYGRTYQFRLEDGDLVWLGQNPYNFAYVIVRAGERFCYAGEDGQANSNLIDPGQEEVKYDLIPMVMVNGTLYLTTGLESTKAERTDHFDGEITSTVEGWQKPTQNDQSNFGAGYGYQYGETDRTIELCVDGRWWIYATEEMRQELQFPDNEIPGKVTHVVDIIDRAEEEGLPCDEAMELFYEDENAEYYFSAIKSHYVLVLYSNAGTEDIVTALNAGRVSIDMLDAFGITYYTVPKN